MPPYAICANEQCPYLFDFKDEEDNDNTPLPPERCPQCKHRTIFYCSTCSWPLYSQKDAQRGLCFNCRVDLRTAHFRLPKEPSAVPEGRILDTNLYRE